MKGGDPLESGFANKVDPKTFSFSESESTYVTSRRGFRYAGVLPGRS